MTDFLPGIVFTWLAIWVLFAFTTNLIYPLVRPIIMALHPARGCLLLLSWITLPAFSALISCLLLFAPMISLIQTDPQCLSGGCGLNLNTGALVGTPAVIIGTWLILSCLAIYARYWRPAQQLRRQLAATSSQSERFLTLPTEAPMAFTLGWLTPQVFITEGLLKQCDAEEIDCILRHEDAHRRRRDGLHQLLAHLFTAVLPNPLIRRQLDDYRLLCEQACDQEAAQHQAEDFVAATLIKIARLQTQHLPHAAPTFIGGHVEARVSALLFPSKNQGDRLPALVWVGLALTLSLVPAASFHWLVLH